MKNSTVGVLPTPTDIPQDVIVTEPAKVEGYLKQHPKLSGLLPAICRSTRGEFGESAELALEIYHDPEIEDHYLNLIVRLPGYDRSTMKRIDAIWENYEGELTASSGWLSITPDFRLLA